MTPKPSSRRAREREARVIHLVCGHCVPRSAIDKNNDDLAMCDRCGHQLVIDGMAKDFKRKPRDYTTRNLVKMIALAFRESERAATKRAVYWYAVEKLRLKADVGAVVAPPRGRRR